MSASKRTKCIELMAIGEMSQTEIAKELGMADSTVSRWRKKPEFMEEVVARSRVLLKESLPEIYSSLKQNSKKGNDRHIKIFLDHLEKLEEVKSNQASITFTWKGPTNDQD